MTKKSRKAHNRSAFDLRRCAYFQGFSEKAFLGYMAKNISKSERKAIGSLPSNIHMDDALKPDDLWMPLVTLRFPRSQFDDYLHNLENAIAHLALHSNRMTLHQTLYITALYLFCIRNTARGMDVASDAIRLSLELLSDADLESKMYFAAFLEWLGTATRKPYWNQHLIVLGIAMLDLLLSAQRLQEFRLRFKCFEAIDPKSLRLSSYAVSFPADWQQLKRQIADQVSNEVRFVSKVAL